MLKKLWLLKIVQQSFSEISLGNYWQRSSKTTAINSNMEKGRGKRLKIFV